MSTIWRKNGFKRHNDEGNDCSEELIDDGWRENALGLLMSLNMLIEMEGGFDYPDRGWMAEAGFGETRVEHLLGPISMVVRIK